MCDGQCISGLCCQTAVKTDVKPLRSKSRNPIKSRLLRILFLNSFHSRDGGFASMPVSMQFHRSPYIFDLDWREMAKCNAIPSNSIARCVKNVVMLVSGYSFLIHCLRSFFFISPIYVTMSMK